jgi:hypothetical protein
MQAVFAKIYLIAIETLLWQVQHAQTFKGCINENVTYGARVAICGTGGADEGATQCIIELDALRAHMHVSLTVQNTEAIALWAARIKRYCEIPHIHVTWNTNAMPLEFLKQEHMHKQQRKHFPA